MTEDKARELAKRFGIRMCDESGNTHGEELYCVGLDDIMEMAKALAQPEQEPFRFTDKENWLSGNGRMWSEMHREEGDFPVYTTPPQRTWVGLTPEEVKDIQTNMVYRNQAFRKVIEAIEAKLKEKNNG